MGRSIILLFALLFAVIADFASAEPVTTIRNNGDPANRVDIVILGDGYTAAQLRFYAADVEGFVNGLFAEQPLREYHRYFNVHRVDVASNESGADHPERSPPLLRNTAFDATYNCFGIQRLICVDTGKVFDVLLRSVAPDQRDVVLVIVNDPEYGGSGGAVAVASIHTQVVELVLHELGHSFGLLADEYDSSPPPCDNAIEPFEPNVTKEFNRSAIKWNVGGGPPRGWIDLNTPIPTTNPSPGMVGLYEGAKYCTTGLFRPTFDSKMRSLNRPFEQVNSEQLVRRIYNWVSPIDASEPVASAITLPANGRQEFRVQTPTPLTGSLEVNWKVDGQIVATGTQFILNAVALTSGAHSIEASVADPTLFVHDDPARVLVDARTWTVHIDISPLAPDTMISSSPPALSKSANSVFVFASTLPESQFSCSLDGAPFAACKSPKKYSRLINGVHLFQVRATDSQGISDATPAVHSWTIDTTRPDTTITTKPAALTNIVDASFEFASSEGNSAFQCRLNKDPFAACTSPKMYAALTTGKYSFQVAAIDSAGNVEKKAAVYKWTIDTTAPETAIKAKPRAATNSTSAKFSFSANERGSTFECSLDGAPFGPCLRSQVFAGLALGDHTLQVRATDPAGNTDATPASYSWTIQ